MTPNEVADLGAKLLASEATVFAPGGMPDDMREILATSIAGARASGDAARIAALRIASVIGANDRARAWFEANRTDRGVASRGFGGTAGLPGEIDADVFVCPFEDWTWARPSIGVPVPPCPVHHVRLDPQA